MTLDLTLTDEEARDVIRHRAENIYQLALQRNDLRAAVKALQLLASLRCRAAD